MMNLLDDFLGSFDLLDWLEAELTFLFRGRSTAEYRMMLNDEHSLNEVIAYLKRYGVDAVRSGFNSSSMTYKISARQKKWHDRLVTYQNGVPTLHPPKRAWGDK